MRAFLLLALIAPTAQAGLANVGAKLLTEMISNLSSEVTDLTNTYQESKNRAEQNIAGLEERADAFNQQKNNAESQKDGFAGKAKLAGDEAAETQAHHDTLKADINALSRVMKVTESQTLEQLAEIDAGLSAVALAKQKVSEMGSAPASLMQVIAPHFDADDFEAMYEAKKGKTSLLAKAGNAFTSSSDVLMNKLAELEDKMVENKKSVQNDHKGYKNKRNQIKATKTVEAQQAQERIDTLKADQAHYTSQSKEAEADESDYSSQEADANNSIANKKKILAEQKAEFEEQTDDRNAQKKLYKELLDSLS